MYRYLKKVASIPERFPLMPKTVVSIPNRFASMIKKVLSIPKLKRCININTAVSGMNKIFLGIDTLFQVDYWYGYR